jgi:lambda family phage portal protein
VNQLLDHRGAPISGQEIARIRADADRRDGADWGGYAGEPYDGGRMRGQWFDRWRQAIRSPDLEYLPYRDLAVARARDLVRNEPLAAAAVSRAKNSTIGRGWRLSAKPNARALKIDPAAAAELAGQIESEWRMHTEGHAFTSDSERRLTFGQQLRLACHGILADGEAVGVAEWAADEGTRYATRLRLVDPDRLSNPVNRINDAYWRNGVESNRLGQPIRYWFRQAHPADYVWTGEAFEWIGVDRFTPWGRPQVFHVYEHERAHQSRGVTKFVQSLKLFRGFSKFDDYTLQNAAANALYIGFVTSSSGPGPVSESLSPEEHIRFSAARRAWYDKHPISADDEARFSVVPPGDEIKLATAPRQVAEHAAYARTIWRQIASSLDMTYEEVTMDFSQTNYSSARAALIYAKAATEARIGLIESQLVKPFYVAWLEEAFDRGYIVAPKGAPDFEDAIDAYAEARWIGPGQGSIDPVKEALAAAVRMELNLTTLDDEAAGGGKYWEDQLHQAAREDKLRQELGLQPSDSAVAQAIEDAKNPAKQAPKPSDPEGDPAPEDDPPAKPKPDPDGASAAAPRRRGVLGGLLRRAFADALGPEA